MNGVIIIDKPCGKTSHDIVGFVRRLIGEKKVGHTGTLDPEATGVLPICIGKATKACDKLTCENKKYRAEMMLGMITDTQDADGKILAEQPVNVTQNELQEAVNCFIGEIEQIPPMYSAIKVDGKKLYELARQGMTVERKKRKVTIFSIDIIEFDKENDLVTIDVSCSKGTYIRTLCEDIGMKLGCGAFITKLRRIKSGRFDIDNSYSLEQLKELYENGQFEEKLIPIDELFSEYEKYYVNDRQKGFITNGVKTKVDNTVEGQIYRVYDKEGNFLCLSKSIDERLCLEKAFWE